MEITLLGVGYVVLITALVQVIKSLGIDSRYAPVAAIILGVVVALGTIDVSVSAIITGVASGLAAVGLYSTGGKEVAKVISGK